MALFGGLSSQGYSRNLVEFKAGKMHLRGNMVYPDKRKGLVYLYQSNDMLMHLCWKDRASNSPEDDLVIFPDEIEFKKVTQNTTGRVYILKWRSHSRKLFFWMQEPKEDKDEEFCAKINDLLNHPPTHGFGDDSMDTDSAHRLHPLMERMAGNSMDGFDSNDLSNALRSMNPNEFASLLSSFGAGIGPTGPIPSIRRDRGRTGVSPQQATRPILASTSARQAAVSRPNTAPASTSVTTTTVTSTSRNSDSSSGQQNDESNSPPSSSSSTTGLKAAASSTKSSDLKGGTIHMSALTSVLSSLSRNANETAVSSLSSSQPAVDLCDTINSESLLPLLSNKDVQDKLRVHLPEENNIPSTEEELRASIQSPQFRQIVNAFSVALQSGELAGILNRLDFPDEVTLAADRGELRTFAQALEKYYRKSDDKDNEENSSNNTTDTS